AELGHEIGLGDLFNAPSPAQLANHIQNETPPVTFDKVMLALRPGGTLPPLFCIHPATGLGIAFAALLRHLAVERPLYALQARSFADPAAAPATLEAMVEDYLAEIRKVQPQGPYHLIGWSSGAAIAHAIAVRLQQQGEAVPLLASMDGYPAGSPYQALMAFELPSSELQRETRSLVEAYLDAGLRRHLASRQVVDETTISAMLRLQGELTELVLHAQSGVYQGDLILFTCPELQGPLAVPPPEIWAAHVTGRIETFPVPDEHSSMLLPASAAIIGEVMDHALRRLAFMPQNDETRPVEHEAATETASA
ncbi:alpha/beta fold hydrolase, partial [Acidisoma sp. C75]